MGDYAIATVRIVMGVQQYRFVLSALLLTLSAIGMAESSNIKSGQNRNHELRKVRIRSIPYGIEGLISYSPRKLFHTRWGGEEFDTVISNRATLGLIEHYLDSLDSSDYCPGDFRLVLLLDHGHRHPDTMAFSSRWMTYKGKAYDGDTRILKTIFPYLPERHVEDLREAFGI
jgi:hypothetical protein